MGKIYQIRIWCSDDSCEEFWFDKELSDYFYNFEDAEAELKKYDGKTREELEAMCSDHEAFKEEFPFPDILLLTDTL